MKKHHVGEMFADFCVVYCNDDIWVCIRTGRPPSSTPGRREIDPNPLVEWWSLQSPHEITAVSEIKTLLLLQKQSSDTKPAKQALAPHSSQQPARRCSGRFQFGRAIS